MPVDFRCLLRLARDVARVARVGLEGDRVVDEAVDIEGLVIAERVDHRGRRVRQEDHVGLVDLLEAADRRSVEAVSLAHRILGQLVNRNRKVLHETGQIAEPEIDDLHTLVSCEPDDFRCRELLHTASPLSLESHSEGCQ